MKFCFSFPFYILIAILFAGCKKEDVAEPNTKLPVVNVTSSVINGATLNGYTRIQRNIAELVAGKYVVSGSYEESDPNGQSTEIVPTDTLIITACGDSNIIVGPTLFNVGSTPCMSFTFKDNYYIFSGDTINTNIMVYFPANRSGLVNDPITIVNDWNHCEASALVTIIGRKIQ